MTRIFLATVIGLLCSATLDAQADGPMIKKIVWEGVNEERQRSLEAQVLTKAGQRLDDQTLRSDIANLWALRRVKLSVDQELTIDGEVILYFKVQEPRILERSSFLGNYSFTIQELREHLFPGRTTRLHEEEIQRLANKLREYYLEEGFAFVEVMPRVDAAESKVIFEILEGPKVYVTNVVFHGNDAIPASRFLDLGTRLKAVMELSEPIIFGIGGSVFSERRLREDLIALRDMYRAHGYLDVSVWERDRVFDEEHSHVEIHIDVDEGPLYRIGDVSIVGNEVFPESELRGLLRMRPGMAITRALIQEDTLKIQDYYGRQGFLSYPTLEEHMSVDVHTVARLDAPVADITLEIREGPRRKLADIHILGNDKTRTHVILREMRLFPDDIVDSEEISRAIARLQSTRFFLDAQQLPAVRSTIQATKGEPGYVDWVVEVEEGSTGNLNFGGGVGSNSGPFLTVAWANRNFGLSRMPSSFWSTIPELLTGEAFSGDGQELSLSASPGLQLSMFNLRFRDPDLFGDFRETIGFQVDAFRRLRLFETHFEDRIGGRLSFTKHLTNELSVGIGGRVEGIDFDDINPRSPQIVFDQEGRNSLHAMDLTVAYRDVDIPRRPTQGYGGTLSYELVGGPFGGDFDFHRITAGGEFYHLLGKDQRGRPSVLAFDAQAGWSEGFRGTREIPYQERFFMGGLGSVRAFDFRGVGPVANDLPLGGEVFWTLSGEYRFPLLSTPIPRSVDEFEWVRGYLWTDWGALGLTIQDSTMSQIRGAAGVGIRIRLPPLPQASLDLNFGFPLVHERTDDERVFLFNLTTFGS